VTFHYQLFPPAVADSDEIADWYSERGRDVAVRFYNYWTRRLAS
jgi:hypothetical protein